MNFQVTWTSWPGTQLEITTRTHLRPSIKSNSHKFSKIQTYHLRSVQTQWEDLVRYFQNSWYKLYLRPMYPLHSHLRVILWKRNRDLKCNSLGLFFTRILSPMYPLHLHLCVVLWMRNRDLKCNNVYFFVESYIFRSLRILFTCAFRWSCEWQTKISSVIVVFHRILKGSSYPLHSHF